MREGGVKAARNSDGSRGHSSPSKFVGTLEGESEREGEWEREGARERETKRRRESRGSHFLSCLSVYPPIGAHDYYEIFKRLYLDVRLPYLHSVPELT
jgi:hypothetical protein